MTDSDEKAVEVMARAIWQSTSPVRLDAAESVWRDMPDEFKRDGSDNYTAFSAKHGRDYYRHQARAAYEAHQRYVKETMNEIVMGEGGDVEDGEKEN